ncbi:uncharacterized protein LOC106165395 [Lingula anatina]|uniref:Uncharacterized protein LOC106165395 n=1 Tax=Lingula anatina TaxID=7574 RepID=A0A1S3IMC9_LINAN|nr:uncharacterized protein LOC106165395 [Lingula anatina]|eukprot:XP_013399056.2 uncharacterized protein LOC106165395 [Lingula anatina]
MKSSIHHVPGNKVVHTVAHNHSDQPQTQGGGVSVITKTSKAPSFLEQTITKFQVILFDSDNPDSVYAPGDYVKGQIILHVKNPLDLQFIEVVVKGEGVISWGHSSARLENYVFKRTFMAGSPDNSVITVLHPGRYATAFQYHLPTDIPSSTDYVAPLDKFSFHIGYAVEARICDYAMTKVTKGKRFLRQQVRILQEDSHPFVIQRPFSITDLPGAFTPIQHVDVLTSSILKPLKSNDGVVKLQLHRSAYSVGDSIILHIEINAKTNKPPVRGKIDLEQKVTTVNPMRTFVADIAGIEENLLTRHRRDSEVMTAAGVHISRYEFALELPRNLLPSHLPGCKLITVTYTLKARVDFAGSGGQWSAKVPLQIAPETTRRDSASSSSTVSQTFFRRPSLTFHNANNHHDGLFNSLPRPSLTPSSSSSYQHRSNSLPRPSQGSVSYDYSSFSMPRPRRDEDLISNHSRNKVRTKYKSSLFKK